MQKGAEAFFPDKHSDVPTANENAPKEEPQQREIIEGGSLGKVLHAVQEAPAGAVIFVTGFRDRRYSESVAALAEQKNVELVDREDFRGSSERYDTVLARAKDKLPKEGESKTVVDMPTLLLEMLRVSNGVPESEGLDKLLEPDANAEATLNEWLKKLAEEGGDSQASGESRMGEAFKKLQKFIAGVSMHGPVMFALPADSPLALAFFTYAAEDKLTPEAIERTAKHCRAKDAVGTVRIEGGWISVAIEGVDVGSRRF